MAEINREDLFSDEVFKAADELAKKLNAIVASIDAITASSMKSGDAIKSANSAGKVAKETEQLTLQEKELLKVQNQISAALAKNNDEYIEHKRGLDALNKVLKDKINADKAEEGSIKALTKANAELKKQRDQISTSTEAGRAKIAALNAEMQKNTEQIKANSTEAEKQKANIGNYASALTDLKQQLKEAKAEMVLAADAGGIMSKEYQEAAKKAGELQDKISDAKDESKVFANDTAIGALGTRFGLLNDKIKSLDFKGAGEQLKGINDLARQTSFKDLIAGTEGFGSALKSLATTILTNPIFILGAVITAAALTWNYFKEQAQKAFESTVRGAERSIEKIEEFYDLQIRLAEISGKTTFDLERKKQEAIIKTADDTLKKIGDVTEIEILKSILAGKVVLSVNEEKAKSYGEYVKKRKKASDELTIIAAQEAAYNRKIEEENAAKAKAEADKLAEKRRKDKEQRIKDEQDIADAVSKAMADSIDARFDAMIMAQFRAKEFIERLRKDLGLEVKLSTSMEEAILAGKQAINRQIEKANQDSLKKRTEDEQTALKEQIEAAKEFISQLTNLYSSLNDKRMQEIQMERNSIKERLDKELQWAGNNEAAKEQLKRKAAQDDAKLAQEQLRIRQRQARFDKAMALFNGGLSIANNILKYLGNPIAVALAAAAGAAQIAAIASKPIPQFSKGTKSAPGGLSLVGELGQELFRTPSGQIGLTPGTASLMNVPKGTEIIPNDETMRMLAFAGISSSGNVGNRNSELVNEMRDLKYTISSTISSSDQRIVQAIIDNGGDLITQGSLIYKQKKALDGSRSLVRKKILG